MKQTLITITLILTFTFSSLGQTAENQLVKKSFDSYKTAVMNSNGEEAVKYVDSRTINYYSAILDLVKNADSTQVDSLNIFDKLMVLSVRHRTSKKEILAFNGKSLLVYAIKSGMISKSDIANNTLGDISIDSLSAKGQFVVNGNKAPFYYNFYKEEQQWKVNLTSIFPFANAELEALIKDSEQTENEAIFMLLAMQTSKMPGSEIWVPVK